MTLDVEGVVDGCVGLEKSLVFEQIAHEFQYSFSVLSRLNQEIEDFAFTLYRAPQKHPLSIDRNENLASRGHRVSGRRRDRLSLPA